MQRFEDAYRALSLWIDPYRLLSLIISGPVFLWAYQDLMAEADLKSATSSPAGSEASTPDSTPPNSPRSDRVLGELAEALRRQQEVMTRIANQQEAMRVQMQEQGDDRRMHQILAEATSSKEPGLGSADRAALDNMMKRMESFTEVLQADRGAASGGAGRGAGLPPWRRCRRRAPHRRCRRRWTRRCGCF